MNVVSWRGLNPVMKLALLLLFAVVALLVGSVLTILLMASLLLLIKVLTGSRAILTRGVVTFALVIVAVQIVFVPRGETLWDPGLIRVTWGGVGRGLLTAGKFLSIAMMSWIFVSTTRPGDLSAALSGVGIPYRYSFLLVLSMRLVPQYRMELSTVREAQAVRGLRATRSPSGIWRSIRCTTMPLLFCALSRVNTLSASMEGRGFSLHPRRSYMHPVRMRAVDVLIGFVLLSLGVGIIVADRLLLAV